MPAEGDTSAQDSMHKLNPEDLAFRRQTPSRQGTGYSST